MSLNIIQHQLHLYFTHSNQTWILSNSLNRVQSTTIVVLSLSLGWHGNRVWYSCTHDQSYEKCNTSTCQSFEYAIKSMRKSITYPNINHYTQYLYTLHCLYIYTILIWHLCGTQISYSVSINFTLPSEIY